MQYKIKSVILTFLIGMLITATSFANSLPATSDGGLQLGSTDGPYWFNISGTVKLDSRSYTGDVQTTPGGYGMLGTYIDAVFVRDAGLSFVGGIGENYTYTVELNFDTYADAVSVDYAYITYNGFRNVLPNLSFSLGQVVPGFCLNCASSSKWIPFMERDMGTNTFGPQAGIGVNSNTYDDHYSATIAITQQPSAGVPIRNAYGQAIRTHDRWQGSVRLTWAPISDFGRVIQIGLSGHVQEYANTGLQFKANPEMRSPRSTTLLNTTNYDSSTFVPGIQYGNPPPNVNQVWIAARSQETLDVELLGIYGPLSATAEFQRAFVTRGKVNGIKQGSNLHFSGCSAQAAYVLTGEVRPLKKSNGTLGQIKPKNSKYGAWEIGGRYSFITLNDHDITGGRANNGTVALSWYTNKNIKFMGEYVMSFQRRQFATYLDKRFVGGIGLRAQFIF